MKNKKSVILILCILFIYLAKPIYSWDPYTIYTPNQSPVDARINFTQLTQAEIQACYDWVAENYPGATAIAPPSNQYMCHGYAWHTSETAEEVQIPYPNMFPYWVDLSYIEIDGWIEDEWAYVEKIFYNYSGNWHSAIYYSGTYYSPFYDSKWGNLPLMRHAEDYCPYFVNFSSIEYYKPNSSTSIDDNHLLTTDIVQINNHPNPFNPSTTISYSLSDNFYDPKIEIYNIKGQKVKSYQLENITGENSIVWNGKDYNNKSVSSGVYFYRLVNEEEAVQSRKMLMIK